MEILSGTIIDTLAVIVAGVLGLIFYKKNSEKSANQILDIIALVALVVGIDLVLKTNNILLPMLALIIGSIISQKAKLSQKNLFDITPSKKNKVYKAFITATLMSLIGPLAIIGPLKNGYSGDPSLLILKAAFDFITTIILSSTLGKGVVFSAIPIFVFQSIIAVLGRLLGDFIPDLLITEIAATGGLILIAMSLSILKLKKLSIINMLVGLLLVPFIYLLFTSVGLI